MSWTLILLGWIMTHQPNYTVLSQTVVVPNLPSEAACKALLARIRQNMLSSNFGECVEAGRAP